MQRSQSRQARVFQSNERFCSEKRSHRASVGNVNTPPDASIARTPERTSGFTSHARFSSSKKLCRADVSPQRGGSVQPASTAPPSPQRMVSHAQFRSEKARHTVLMDSPMRVHHQPPATPPSVSSYRSQSRERSASVERSSQGSGDRPPAYAHTPSHDRRSRERTPERSESSYQSYGDRY